MKDKKALPQDAAGSTLEGCATQLEEPPLDTFMPR